MKQLLITIAALVLFGCGASVPNITIHKAAEKGDIYVVKQHLKAGTDVNLKNWQGKTPLDFSAARYVHTSKINQFLRERGGIYSSIHMAVQGDDIQAVKKFLDDGVDVNLKGDGQWTPLYYTRSKEVAELLISKGANVHAKSVVGDLPLDWIYASEARNTIRKNGGKYSSFAKACYSPDLEAVKEFLNSGADVINVYREDGRTILDNLNDQIYMLERGVQSMKKLGTPFTAYEEEVVRLDSYRRMTDFLRKHGAKTGEELKAEGK